MNWLRPHACTAFLRGILQCVLYVFGAWRIGISGSKREMDGRGKTKSSLRDSTFCRFAPPPSSRNRLLHLLLLCPSRVNFMVISSPGNKSSVISEGEREKEMTDSEWVEVLLLFLLLLLLDLKVVRPSIHPSARPSVLFGLLNVRRPLPKLAWAKGCCECVCDSFVDSRLG